MTSGFVAFGVVMPVFAQALGRSLGSRAVTAAVTVAGLTTLGVALTPLSIEGGTTIDTLHAIAAGSGYVAMAVTPALAARAMPTGGVAATSYAVSAVSALALIGSLAQPDLAGFCQRLGLGVVDVWLATAAVVLLRRARH